MNPNMSPKMPREMIERITNHVHSSGYAKAAYGPRIGSTSAQSFNNRYQLERNRRVIGAYKHSQVGSAPSHEELQASKANRQRQTIEPRQAMPQQPVRTFREPPTRPRPF